MTNRTFTLIGRRRRALILGAVLLFCGSGPGRPFATAQQNRITDRVSSAEPRVLLEGFSFSIDNFKMDHQGEVQTLELKISFQYVNGIRTAAYPDFRLIARDVETLLSKYPNKTDYWEVVNKRLTQLILDKYLGLARVTSEIEVSASTLVPYVRASTVTRLRRKK